MNRHFDSIRWLMALFLTLTLTACGGSSDGAFDNALERLEISYQKVENSSGGDTQPEPSRSDVVAIGDQLQFTAIAIYSNGEETDVTSQVQFKLANPAMGRFTDNIFTALMDGPLEVSATFNGIESAPVKPTVSLTEDAKLLYMELNSTQLAVGSTLKLELLATFSSLPNDKVNIATQNIWQIADPEVVSIEYGVLTAKKTGVTTITASKQNIADEAPITVSATIEVTDSGLTKLMVTSPTLELVKHDPVQLRAVATYADGSERDDLLNLLTWTGTSSDTIMVDEAGKITAYSEGTYTISAKVDDVTSAPLTFTVINSAIQRIAFPQSQLSIGLDFTETARIIAYDEEGQSVSVTNGVEWIISNPNVVEVVDGQFKPKAEGTAEVSAIYAKKQTPNKLTITVWDSEITEIVASPAKIVLPVNATKQLTANAIFSNGEVVDVSDLVTWNPGTLDNQVVVKIDGFGVMTGVGAGNIMFNATYRDNNRSINSNFIDVAVVDAPLDSLQAGPTEISIPSGESAELSVQGFFLGTEELFSEDLTSAVSWTITPKPQDASLTYVDVVDNRVYGYQEGSYSLQAKIGDKISNTIKLTVTKAVVTKIELLPPAVRLPLGVAFQLNAKVTFSDLSSTTTDGDLAELDKIDWISSDDSKVTVTETGLLQANALTGSNFVTIRALRGGVETTMTVEVTSAEPANLTIGDANTPDTLAKGHTLQLVATLTDTTGAPITPELLTWTSSDNEIATVDPTTGLVTAIKGSGDTPIIITVEGYGLTATKELTIIDTEVESVQIRIANWETTDLPIGINYKLQAVATFKGGTDAKDVTENTVFTTNTGISPVLNDMYLSIEAAAGIESMEIYARHTDENGVVTDAIPLPVMIVDAALEKLTVTSSSTSLAQGSSAQLNVLGQYRSDSEEPMTQDLTTAIEFWEITTLPDANDNIVSGSVVTIDDETGVITGIIPGASVEIRAKMLSITNDLVVSDPIVVQVGDKQLHALEILDSAEPIAHGTTRQLTAQGIYTNGDVKPNFNSSVNWSVAENSSGKQIISVDPTGLIKAENVGTAQLTITSRAETGVNLTKTVDIKVSAVTLEKIVISPGTARVPRGTEYAFRAIGTYTNGHTQDISQDATWRFTDELFDDEALVTLINEPGEKGILHTGKATRIGPLVIMAEMADPVSGNRVLSDPAPITITPAVLKELRLTAIRGEEKDDVIFTAALGTTQQLKLEGIYSDGDAGEPADVELVDLSNQLIDWSKTSDDNASEDVFRMASLSVAHANALGISKIVATYDGVTSNEVTGVAVDPSVSTLQITSPADTLIAGKSLQLRAVATYVNNTMQDITNEVFWRITDDSAGQATISGSGELTGVSKGVVTIVASSPNFTSLEPVTIDVEITDPVPASIYFSPAVPTLVVGESLQFKMDVLKTNGEVLLNVAGDQFNWETSDGAVLNVVDGVIEAKSAGTANVKATYAEGDVSITGTIGVEVRDAVLESIRIEAPTTMVPVGMSLPFSAIGLYSDDQERTITNAVVWLSSNSATGVLDAQGNFNALEIGNTQVQATLSGITSTPFDLYVTEKTVSRIEILETEPKVAAGLTVQLTAEALFSDGERRDVTKESQWSSSKPAVATIDWLTGLVTGVTPGTTEVTVIKNGRVSEPVIVEVVNAKVMALSLSSAKTITMGDKDEELRALAKYSSAVQTPAEDDANEDDNDLTTQYLEGAANWQSSNTAVAKISPYGEITPVGVGETIIQVNLGNVRSNAMTLRVTELEVAVCGYDPVQGDLSIGNGIDDESLDNAGTDCLKVRAVTEHSTKWFTSVPSEDLLIALDYTIDDEPTNEGFTYASLNPDAGAQFGLFRRDSGSLTGQAARFCENLADRRFAGRTDWKVPTLAELESLHAYHAENDNGNLEDSLASFGWPVGAAYWSNSYDAVEQGVSIINLGSGLPATAVDGNNYYISCVAELD